MSEVVDYARSEQMDEGRRARADRGAPCASRGSLTSRREPGPIDRPKRARPHQIVNIDGDRHASARRRRLPVITWGVPFHRLPPARPGVRAQHPRRRIVEVTPVSPRVVRRQRGVRHRPGKSGQTLETSIGPVPVFNSVARRPRTRATASTAAWYTAHPRRATVWPNSSG